MFSCDSLLGECVDIIKGYSEILGEGYISFHILDKYDSISSENLFEWI